jgi:hypothetical protein
MMRFNDLVCWKHGKRDNGPDGVHATGRAEAQGDTKRCSGEQGNLVSIYLQLGIRTDRMRTRTCLFAFLFMEVNNFMNTMLVTHKELLGAYVGLMMYGARHQRLAFPSPRCAPKHDVRVF